MALAAHSVSSFLAESTADSSTASSPEAKASSMLAARVAMAGCEGGRRQHRSVHWYTCVFGVAE